MIKAVIFDVDGTLLDTRKFIFTPFEQTFKRFNHDVPSKEEISKVIGLSLRQCYEKLLDDNVQQSYLDAHHQFQQGKMGLITAYGGLNEMLDSLRRQGLTLSVFSSRSGSLLPSLKNFDIDKYFQVIVSGSDVENHKPHPEGLQKIISHHGFKKGEVMMVGDTIFDIQAAKSAGLQSIAVTHGFGKKQTLIDAKPEHIVDSLRGVQEILLARSRKQPK